jgi:hypothetical protein
METTDTDKPGTGSGGFRADGHFVFNGPLPEGYDDLGGDGRYIRDILMSEWFHGFLQKARDYNDNQNENHRVLGTRGQFADIWRKIGKLKKALWDGQPLVGEQPREILMDLIAHCFLTIAMMDDSKMVPYMEQGEPLVPSCGREKCVAHGFVPRSRVNLLLKHD